MRTFIPIESDISNDDRMSALLIKTGPAGFGVYLILLIELRKRKNYSLDSQSLKIIARQYNIRTKILNDVLYNYNLFTIEQRADGNISITSQYVSEIMQSYNEKVEKSRTNGRKGAQKRWAAKDSEGHSHPITTEQNRTEQNRTTEEKEKEKEETAVPVDAAIADVVIANATDVAVAPPVSQPQATPTQPRWKIYLAEALNDQAWTECQAMHSGLGLRFMQYKPLIADLFARHVITHGKEGGLLSTGDVKNYFAHFVRQGTLTNKRIAGELEKHEQQQQCANPYRYETIDPVTGHRTFQGIAIPPDAPPRPNDQVTWISSLGKWG